MNGNWFILYCEFLQKLVFRLFWSARAATEIEEVTNSDSKNVYYSSGKEMLTKIDSIMI
jgi:hypothetical protein